MPPFRPARSIVPKSAMPVGPALRSKKVPNPSPPGGVPLGAPPRGLQYGKNPNRTGRAWIPRIRNNVFVRGSPDGWRQPRKRLANSFNNGEQPQQQPRQRKKPTQSAEALRQQKLYGWGVTAPSRRGRANGETGAPGAAKPAAAPQQRPRPTNPIHLAMQRGAKAPQYVGPNVVTRQAAAKAKGAYEAKKRAGPNKVNGEGCAPPEGGCATKGWTPEELLHC